MAGNHRQVFPSGEVREFAGEEGQVMVLVSHVRADGDPSTENLIGASMDEMPPPWEAEAE